MALSAGLWIKSRLLKAKNKALEINAEYNPFELDLAKLTAEITVKRENNKPPVALSLLTILDIIAVEGKSIANIAEDFSKAIGLEKELYLSESEARIIMMYVSPTLYEFHASLKKASPFGLD